MKNLKNKDKSLKEQNNENLVAEDTGSKDSNITVTDTNESGTDLPITQDNKNVENNEGFTEQKVEDNIDHNASPFGKNGFMK